MTPLLRKRVASGKLPKRDKGAVAGDQEVEQSSESEFDPTATTRGVVTQNHAPGRSTEDDQFMNTGAPTRGRASHERRIQCLFMSRRENLSVPLLSCSAQKAGGLPSMANPTRRMRRARVFHAPAHDFG
jgi:hypothetical protein